MTLPVNKYLALCFGMYALAVLWLIFQYQQQPADMIFVLAIPGIGFSSLAWVLTKKIQPPFHREAVAGEKLVLAVLLILILWYISYGTTFINGLMPAKWRDLPNINSLLILVRKLLVFVIVPYTAYRVLGFSLANFGLNKNKFRFFSARSVVIFITMSVVIVLFQFYLSHGGKSLQSAGFHPSQLIKGLPLCFMYLLFDAGLVEEFFFRGLLQSRLATLLKSQTAGIAITAIIFGLVHAPGLYLRGSAGEGVSEPMPFLFWCCYVVAYMSLAGIFLGIIYSKTTNLWLVIAIHAMVDLIPNTAEFITNWGL